MTVKIVRALINSACASQDCLKKMSMIRRTQDYDNCVFDACAMHVFDTTVCTFGNTLSKTCIEEYNVQTVWRSETFCRKGYT